MDLVLVDQYQQTSCMTESECNQTLVGADQITILAGMHQLRPTFDHMVFPVRLREYNQEKCKHPKLIKLIQPHIITTHIILFFFFHKSFTI